MDELIQIKTDEFVLPPSLVDNYDGKFIFADEFKEPMREICSVQGLQDTTDRILVFLDTSTHKNGPACSVAQLSSEAKDMLLQLTGHVFDVSVSLKDRALNDLNEAQVSHVLYHALRHTVWDAKKQRVVVVQRHDCECWNEQAEFVDGDGFQRNAPNLMNTPLTQNAAQAATTVLRICKDNANVKEVKA